MAESIKKNYFYNTLLNVSNILMPLITYPYVLRVIGPEGLGKANFALSIAGYFLIIAQFGVPMLGVKEIAKARDNAEKLKKVFSELFVINLVTSLLSILFYLCVIVFFEKFRQDPVLFFVAGATLAVNIASIDWLYKGLEEYGFVAVRSFALRLVYIALTFIVIRTGADYVWYAGLAVFIMLAGNIVNMAVLPRKTGITLAGLEFKKYIKPMTLVFAAAAATSVYNKLDVVILGLLSNDAAVGYYTANRRVILLVLAVTTSLTAVMVPRAAYYVGKKMDAEYRRTSERSLDFLYFASVPVIALTAVYADELLRVLGGGKFVQAALSLRILSLQILLTGIATTLASQV
ncbi:MAG TPA: flippase, partial [Candidatus Goldiibacteriota bacterium]|nr:flippase [Candidatus Goldiibacteriota bacterium]